MIIDDEIKEIIGITTKTQSRYSQLQDRPSHHMRVRGAVPNDEMISAIEEVFSRRYEDYTLFKSVRYYTGEEVVILEFRHKSDT